MKVMQTIPGSKYFVSSMTFSEFCVFSKDFPWFTTVQIKNGMNTGMNETVKQKLFLKKSKHIFKNFPFPANLLQFINIFSSRTNVQKKTNRPKCIENETS